MFIGRWPIFKIPSLFLRASRHRRRDANSQRDNETSAKARSIAFRDFCNLYRLEYQKFLNRIVYFTTSRCHPLQTLMQLSSLSFQSQQEAHSCKSISVGFPIYTIKYSYVLSSFIFIIFWNHCDMTNFILIPSYSHSHLLSLAY